MSDLSRLKILLVDDHLLAQKIVVPAMRQMHVTNIAAVPDSFAAFPCRAPIRHDRLYHVYGGIGKERDREEEKRKAVAP